MEIFFSICAEIIIIKVFLLQVFTEYIIFDCRLFTVQINCKDKDGSLFVSYVLLNE